MKKILLIAAVAGMAMVSCKKDYTCECTSTVGQSGNTISSTVSTTIKDKKSAAEDACEKGSMDASTATYVSKTECKIK